jgi:hypothetical protein
MKDIKIELLYIYWVKSELPDRIGILLARSSVWLLDLLASYKPQRLEPTQVFTWRQQVYLHAWRS